MGDSEADPVPSARAWDTYWRGTRDGAAYAQDGVGHPAVVDFWRERFAAIGNEHASPALADIATGSGAVVECAIEAFANRSAWIVCADVSHAALARLGARCPSVRGLVADARRLPLVAGRFDVVTSQFGVEYAGLDAVHEAARLVAPGGTLALLLHHGGGRIRAQCAADLDAVRALRASGFLPSATRMFELGFAALRGGSRARYLTAARRLVPAFRALEEIMRRHGRDAAGGTIRQLYTDVDRIHGRMRHYKPAEVLGWLAAMERELPAYEARMASMCRAALDSDTFAALCGRLRGAGYSIERAAPLDPRDGAPPLAWALCARARR